jgi:rhodanese-related sulfurtransferase
VRLSFADLPYITNTLAQDYALPRPVTVNFRDCEQVNAWFDRSDGSITMCYGLLENQLRMIANAESGVSDGAEASNAAMGGGTSDELVDLGVPVMGALVPAPYQGPTPTEHARAELITTDQLAALIKSGARMLLVDTSGAAQTIGGARSVTDIGQDGSLADSHQMDVNAWLNGATGGDKNRPIVFFGRGLQDRSSYNAALRAGALGWNVSWYRGGLDAWVANGLPVFDVAP